MDPARIKLAEDLFQRAADLPALDRAVFIDGACAGDPPLRDFVRAMLQSSQTTGPLDAPMFDRGADGANPAPPHIPPRIGDFEIVRIIGEGGMAVVYEAAQENPRRTVALKVLKSGVVSRESLRRFQHEVQVLGRLQHLCIAHIYGAAVAEFTTPGGMLLAQPYFAMELVRGRPLTLYAAEQRLTIDQKLELLARVCDAVQYAHQNGVIHRDLKPANILVEAPDTPGVASATGSTFAHAPAPKVLDFGVARVIGADPNTPSMNTEAGRIIGTLAYMSPEQLSGNVDQTDTRSDVYALGVILYELLAGRLPHKIDGAALPEAARRIREDEPTRLAAIDRRFRGEVDVIVARAMEKDRARRYTSAADLAADLRRHLRGEAIEARRDSAIYVLRKGLNRNRGIVSAVLAAFAGVAGFAGYAWHQAGRFEKLSDSERSARLEARNEADNARLVSNFLKGVIELANPDQNKGRKLTLTDALDAASRRLSSGELAANPAVEAEIRTTLAETYGNLALSLAAIPHREWLLEYYRRVPGENTDIFFNALTELASAYIESDRLPDAERLLRQSVAIGRARYGSDAAKTSDAEIALGNCLMRQNRNDEALDLTLQGVDAVLRREGQESFAAAFARFQLSGVYRNLARLDDAERMYLLAIPGLDRFQPGSTATIRCRWSYARDCLTKRNKPAEAERSLRQTDAIATAALGPDHPETIATRRELAAALRAQGRTDEALAILRASLDACRAVRAWVVNDEILTTEEIVATLRTVNRLDEAAATAATSFERFDRLRGTLDPETLRALEPVAVLAAQRSDLTTAKARFDDLLARSTELYGASDPRTLNRKALAGRMLHAPPAAPAPPPAP